MSGRSILSATLADPTIDMEGAVLDELNGIEELH